MAAAVPDFVANQLPPTINALSPFTRGSLFGDTHDLYLHPPSSRIGSNYTPTAPPNTMERKKKGPPPQKRTGLESNAEVLAMPVRIGSFPNPDTLFTAPGRVHYIHHKCTLQVMSESNFLPCLLIHAALQDLHFSRTNRRRPSTRRFTAAARRGT